MAHGAFNDTIATLTSQKPPSGNNLANIENEFANLPTGSNKWMLAAAGNLENMRFPV